MSLQTRLAALITAVGADIKAQNGRITALETGDKTRLMATARVTTNATLGTATANTNITATRSINEGTAASGLMALTINAVAGKRYKISYVANLTSTVAGDTPGINCTVGGTASGASLGHLFGQANLYLQNSRFYPLVSLGWFSCSVSGTYTVTMQYLRVAGTGSLSLGGNSFLMIEEMETDAAY